MWTTAFAFNMYCTDSIENNDSVSCNASTSLSMLDMDARGTKSVDIDTQRMRQPRKFKLVHDVIAGRWQRPALPCSLVAPWRRRRRARGRWRSASACRWVPTVRRSGTSVPSRAPRASGAASSGMPPIAASTMASRARPRHATLPARTTTRTADACRPAPLLMVRGCACTGGRGIPACRPLQGSFIRPERVDNGRIFATALRAKYGADADAGKAPDGLYVRTASQRAVPVDRVGFEGIADRMQYGVRAPTPAYLTCVSRATGRTARRMVAVQPSGAPAHHPAQRRARSLCWGPAGWDH